MNILLLGSGGREHAIAWKIAQSPKVDKLFIAPGNAGTALVGTNVDIKADDFAAIKDFALANQVNMVVVGPEDPLVKGVYDYFKKDEALSSIPVIGPSGEGAQLEGSKDFAKAFMMRHNIPTARYKSISAENLEEGYAFLESLSAPYVLKADGLAAGKGVLIIDSLEEAKKELGDMLGGMFGDASKTVVIEEFLDGIECSVFVLTDGNDYKVLPVAKDYKRIGEGNTGLNTGGMGAVSPVPFADEVFMAKVDERLDDGRLTDNKGRTVNFKNTIIIMTSNLGSAYIQSQFEKINDQNHDQIVEETKKEVMNMLKKTIRPEFLNRIDETIMFQPLNKPQIEQIVRLQINGIRKMLEGNGVTLQMTDAAVDFLATAGYDPEFGARPVKRAIQRYLLNDLSKKLLSQEVNREKPIIVEREGDALKFRN